MTTRRKKKQDDAVAVVVEDVVVEQVEEEQQQEEEAEATADMINDTLFAEYMAWFAPTVSPSIVNSFLAGGGTVAVEHSLPAVTLLISNDPLDPDTAAILRELTRLVIDPQWIDECIQSNVIITPITPYLLRPITLRSRPNIIDAYKAEAAAAARMYTLLDAQANVSQTKRKRAILSNQNARESVPEVVKKLKETDMETDEAQVIEIVPPTTMVAPTLSPPTSPPEKRGRGRARKAVTAVNEIIDYRSASSRAIVNATATTRTFDQRICVLRVVVAVS